MKHLPSSICNLKMLRVLTLKDDDWWEYNHDYYGEFSRLPDEIENMQSLEVLNTQSTRLALDLPFAALKRLKNLRIFRLSDKDSRRLSPAQTQSILEIVEENPNFIHFGHNLIKERPGSSISQALVRKRAAQNEIRYCHYHKLQYNRKIIDNEDISAITPNLWPFVFKRVRVTIPDKCCGSCDIFDWKFFGEAEGIYHLLVNYPGILNSRVD